MLAKILLKFKKKQNISNTKKIQLSTNATAPDVKPNTNTTSTSTKETKLHPNLTASKWKKLRGVTGPQLKEKYHRFSPYFEEEVPVEVKYNDAWDKHKQIIEFSPFGANSPILSTSCWVAPNATIAGNVEVWDKSSVWYGCVIRGDKNLVRIGGFTNIQDYTTITEAFEPLEADHDGSTIIGHRVTVGHGCHLRACTIEDECLIGMYSILCEGSYMEKKSILGAKSVLLPGTRVPSGQLWAGNPARYIRDITHEEEENIVKMAENYYRIAKEHDEEFFLPVGTQYIEAEKLGYEIGYDEDEVEWPQPPPPGWELPPERFPNQD